VLHGIDQAAGPTCARELAPVLGIPAPVVEGMLATLAALGTIVPLDERDACRTCPLRASCAVLPAGERLYYNPGRPEA